MKKTFKKALSMVLSLALTFMCLTGAFVSASAETTTTPEKMLKITPRDAGEAISFRQQELTTGHSYKLKMLQSGITGVIPRERVNWSYVNTPAVAGTEGNYTTYTFTCAGDRTRLLFTTAAGTSGYMADIKLYDTTNSTDTGIDFTTMTFVVESGVYSGTYSNWLVDRTDPQSFSPDILNADIANINFIELLDFDADTTGILVPPEENTDYPEKQLRITAPNFGTDKNPYAVIFRKSGLTPGHTYRLALFQKGLLGIKYNLYANGTAWTQYSMETVSNGAYMVCQFVPTQAYVEIRFNIGGTGKTSYVADLKLYDLANPTTNLINDIATSNDTTGWSRQMLDANQTSDVDMTSYVVVEDFDRWDFEIFEDWELPENFYKNHSLVLAEEIGVNFFVDLSGLTAEEKEGSYMTFDVTNEIQALQSDYDSTFTNSTGDYHGFTCYLSSVQMAEEIIPSFHYGNGRTITGSAYSAKDYIDYVVAHSAEFNAVNAYVVPLVKAIGDYGHYAQEYFSAKNSWVAGTDYTALEKYRAADYGSDDYTAKKTAVLEYEKKDSGAETGITKSQCALNFNSKTSIGVLVTADRALSGIIVKQNGEAYEGDPYIKKNSNYVYEVKVYNLPILQMDDTFTITNSSETFYVELSGLSYVYSILNDAGKSTSLKNAVSAFYDYYKAADDYKLSIS